MGLYSPLVAPDAVPPAGYPARFVFGRWAAVGAALQALALALALALARAPPRAAAALELAGLAALQAATYAAVSRVYLGRADALGSRYGSRREFAKLLALSPVLWAVALRGALLGDGASERAAEPASFSAAPGVGAVAARASAHAAGLSVGSLFVFLDSFPALQAFGCKVVSPRSWPSLGTRDQLLALALAGVLSALLAAAASSAAAAWRDGAGRAAREVAIVYAAALVLLSALRCAVYPAPRFETHSHHYINCLTLVPLTRLPFSGARFLQAVLVGSVVEGISCWGADPLWYDPSGRGGCSATRFWTGLVLLMGDRARWRLALADMATLLDAAAAVRLGDAVSGLQTSATERAARARADLDSLARLDGVVVVVAPGKASDPATALAAAARQDDVLALAVLSTIVVGLCSGAGELSAMAPGLLGLASESTELDPSGRGSGSGGGSGSGSSGSSSSSSNSSNSNFNFSGGASLFAFDAEQALKFRRRMHELRNAMDERAVGKLHAAELEVLALFQL